MVNASQARSQYSEDEAAAELGISIEELRSLIRRHVVESDEEMSHSSLAAFSASDILVLRILGRDGASVRIGA